MKVLCGVAVSLSTQAHFHAAQPVLGQRNPAPCHVRLTMPWGRISARHVPWSNVSAIHNWGWVAPHVMRGCTGYPGLPTSSYLGSCATDDDALHLPPKPGHPFGTEHRCTADAAHRSCTQIWQSSSR